MGSGDVRRSRATLRPSTSSPSLEHTHARARVQSPGSAQVSFARDHRVPFVDEHIIRIEKEKTQYVRVTTPGLAKSASVIVPFTGDVSVLTDSESFPTHTVLMGQPMHMQTATKAQQQRAATA